VYTAGGRFGSDDRYKGNMQIIRTTDAPTPRGHYSQGIVHDGLVHVAGQLPVDPATGEIVGATAREQAVRTLRNVEAVLRAAGTSLDRVLSLTIYITDERHWAPVNEAVAELFGTHRPARAIIPILPLRGGAMLEIQAVAAVEG
jgi:2-iminobutanoate/2-iminopropanoate deaminase